MFFPQARRCSRKQPSLQTFQSLFQRLGGLRLVRVGNPVQINLNRHTLGGMAHQIALNTLAILNPAHAKGFTGRGNPFTVIDTPSSATTRSLTSEWVSFANRIPPTSAALSSRAARFSPRTR